MASVVGKVKELRKSRSITDSSSAELLVGRNVTEQLRYNHIETLEQLQFLSDENIKLKNELKKFKGELHKSDETEPAVVSEDASAVKVTYIDMIEKEKEIKLLKGKLAKVEMELVTANNTNNRLQSSIIATNNATKNESNKQKEIIIEQCKMCSSKANNEDEKIKILESTLLLKITEMDELHNKTNELISINAKNQQYINDLESQVTNLTVGSQELSSNNLKLQEEICKLRDEMLDIVSKYNSAVENGQEILGKLEVSNKEYLVVKEKYSALYEKYKKLLESLEVQENNKKKNEIFEAEEDTSNPSFFYTSALNLSNYNYNCSIGKSKAIVTLAGGDEGANLSLTYKREVH